MIKSLAELKEHAARIEPAKDIEVYVGAGTCGIAAGALDDEAALKEELTKLGLNVPVHHTGCAGLCFAEPLIEVREKGKSRVWYSGVDAAKAREIAAKHIANKEPLSDAIKEDGGLFEGQTRVALRNCGLIAPECIDDYIAVRGYEALGKAIFEMTPESVVGEIKQSGLRGRGGAGSDGFEMGVYGKSRR
jgi:(2Fe-2S) ferredoxin